MYNEKLCKSLNWRDNKLSDTALLVEEVAGICLLWWSVLYIAHGKVTLASANTRGNQHQVAATCQLKCLQSIFMVLSVSLLLLKIQNCVLWEKESVLKRKSRQLLYLQSTPRSYDVRFLLTYIDYKAWVISLLISIAFWVKNSND